MKKTFDAVAWMRRRRVEIDEEDQGLSWVEKRKKTRELIERDPLWDRLKSRLVEPTSISVGAVHENQEEYGQKKHD
ncbi:MAG: hypothetical protein FJ117_07040 [Deltaproteobacteria bacterium]|nr:hypothetical protein [Deltaproteobacteria bacterium]